jgi:hypothetical protein
MQGSESLFVAGTQMALLFFSLENSIKKTFLASTSQGASSAKKSLHE